MWLPIGGVGACAVAVPRRAQESLAHGFAAEFGKCLQHQRKAFLDGEGQVACLSPVQDGGHLVAAFRAPEPHAPVGLIDPGPVRGLYERRAARFAEYLRGSSGIHPAVHALTHLSIFLSGPAVRRSSSRVFAVLAHKLVIGRARREV